MSEQTPIKITNKIPLLFEDDWVIAVNKPAGLPSQGTRDPRRSHLHAEVEKLIGKKVWLHHRLDKDTTGVILFSKSDKANFSLTEQFREHQVQKTYLALAKPGLVDISIGQEKAVELHMAPVKGERGIERMVVVKKGGWHSQTLFRKLAEGPDSILMEALPRTGRTHQIRVHLAHLRVPILGDFLYGGKSPLVPRLMLHAWKIELKHPITQQPLLIEAPLARDFMTLVERWDFFKGIPSKLS